MKLQKLLSLLIVFSFKFIAAQNLPTNKAVNPKLFPQEINKAIHSSFEQSLQKSTNSHPDLAEGQQSNSSAFQLLKKMEEIKHTDFTKLTHPAGGAKLLDTVYVGGVPHDTLRITGSYSHTGPIFVFNDGVLIVKNSTFYNDGDLYVWGHGSVFADSSAFTFPQQYFYQRSILAVQHGYINFSNSSFYNSGMSHNLMLGDTATVIMNGIHNYDRTTAGLFGYPTVSVNGCNLGGEYILSDNGHATFKHTDTLLLWHQFPNTANVNYAFPQGDTVNHYVFNNTVSGISGINYTVSADTCYNIWWGMMPVNGSNVTISNSKIRTIGAWFQYGDSTHVSGVFDNSTYTNFVMPVTDRNLHLINSTVQTWSLYVFDTSKVTVFNCTLGEVGTENTSRLNADNILLDGSGGYFWATDTSAIIASHSTIYSTTRSEKYGMFIVAYCNMPFAGPTSIGNSIVVSVQNTLATDPVPYDNSNAWMENIASPNTAHADSIIPIKGSVWIDQGPQGGWMFFANYSLSYQISGGTGWTYLVSDSALEIRNNTLANWNTTGIAPGTYILRLVGKSTSADTVEDYKAITISPAVSVSVKENESADFQVKCYPNPATDELTVESSKWKVESVRIYNVLGEVVYQSSITNFKSTITIKDFDKGIYFIEAASKDKRSTIKFIKE